MKTLFFCIYTVLFSFGTLSAKEKEKSWDKCHIAVYGQAEKRLVDDKPYELINEGILTLEPIGALRGIRFESSSSTFIVEHTGTYIIDYFLNASAGNVSTTTILGVGVQINNQIKGPRNLYPWYKGQSLYIGKNSIIENLKKGDRVSLVITKATTTTSYPAFGHGSSSEPEGETFAYLTIYKIETND